MATKKTVFINAIANAFLIQLISNGKWGIKGKYVKFIIKFITLWNKQKLDG